MYRHTLERQLWTELEKTAIFHVTSNSGCICTIKGEGKKEMSKAQSQPASLSILETNSIQIRIEHRFEEDKGGKMQRNNTSDGSEY